MNQTETLQHAAELLRGMPWQFTVTVEYPGYLLITFDTDAIQSQTVDSFGDARQYAAGFANPTLTVDRVSDDGQTINGVDTKVPTYELDGYRMAIHVAAAIDRMEHE